MTKFASILSAATIALALSGTIVASASAAAYDPAADYIGQFSGERGASVRIPTLGGMLSDPAKDYVHSLQSTFRAEKRAGMNDAGYDGFQSYVSQFN